MTRATPADKDASLEALRGLAAVVVLIFHLLLAFHPALPMTGAWWYGFVNGHAAVLVFFVLSGFVLTHRALVAGEGRSLTRGALKRWPRLAGPILISVLLSWALLELGLMAHLDAARLSGSGWMARFGDVHLDGPFVPSLKEAVLQGGVLALFRGIPADRTYNSVLWTMRYEQLGSLIAFALGLALLQLRTASLVVRVAFLAVVALTVRFADAYYLTFVVGVGLALLASAHRVAISWPLAVAVVAFSVWLLGYVEGSRDHAALGALYRGTPPATYVHAGAGALLIAAILCSAALRACLSGRWASHLGRISFALYLLHLPVLFSAGAATYVALGGGLQGALAASAVTIAITWLLCLPLARFDRWWTGLLNRFAVRIVPNARNIPGAADSAPRAYPTAPMLLPAEGGMGGGWIATEIGEPRR